MPAGPRSLPRLVIAALVCCFAACAPTPEAPVPSGGGIVRVFMSADPSSLTMIGKSDANAEILAAQLTDSLVQYDSALTLHPRVAESWELSPDGLTLTFHLREGVRWHDGRPVTAEDVVFTVNKVRDPAVENRAWATQLKDLVEIEAVDDATVRARFALPSGDVLEAFRVPLLPRHLAGADEDLLTGEFSRHPVGCGPFRFVRHLQGQEILLEANDDYWDGRPLVDGLRFRIFPDQRTAFQALLTGELDIMHLTPHLYEEARRSPAANELAFDVFYRLSVWHIGWNQDGSNPFFTDPRVRLAMVLALDRQEFIDNVLGGLGLPGITPFQPGTVWADPALKPHPFDPGRAKQLLDEAGWRDEDGDGTRERDGRPFVFSMMIPASTQKLVDHLAAWQQQSWAEIGVQAEIERVEAQAFRERRGAGQFDAAQGSFHFTPNPDQFYALYHSSAREHGFNFFAVNDPEIDRLLDEGRAATDAGEKREIYFRLQRRLTEVEPLTCLIHFATPVLRRKALTGVRLSPLGYAKTIDGPRLWRYAADRPEDG